MTVAGTCGTGAGDLALHGTASFWQAGTAAIN